MFICVIHIFSTFCHNTFWKPYYKGSGILPLGIVLLTRDSLSNKSFITCWIWTTFNKSKDITTVNPYKLQVWDEHFFLSFFFFLTLLYSLQDLISSLTRDWTYTLCIARWSLNHWATRKVLCGKFSNKKWDPGPISNIYPPALASIDNSYLNQSAL